MYNGIRFAKSTVQLENREGEAPAEPRFPNGPAQQELRPPPRFALPNRVL